MIILKQISEILKNSREDLDMTQISVMQKTGINNKTLSGYENGIAEPDLETFAKLLNLYGLSADAILEIKTPSGNRNVSLSKNEYALVENFRKLDKKRQADFLLMIQALSNN